MKTEFEQIIETKDEQIETLTRENHRLRTLLDLEHNFGKPTEKEIYDEICKYEISLQMRDEVETQTEIKEFTNRQVNTEEVKMKTLEINHLESDDENPQKSTSNLLMARHTKSIEEAKKTEIGKKITTTPQSSQNPATVKSDNKIFSSLVHGGRTKNTIYSVKKSPVSDEEDPYGVKTEYKPKSNDIVIADKDYENEMLPMASPDDSQDDDSPLRSSDELDMQGMLQDDKDHKQIHEIFRNSEIIGKSSKAFRPRYVESEGEDEYEFYDDAEERESPSPGKASVHSFVEIERKDQSIGCSPPRATDEDLHSEEDYDRMDVHIGVSDKHLPVHPQTKEEKKPEEFKAGVIDIKTGKKPVEEIHDGNEMNENDSDDEYKPEAAAESLQNEETKEPAPGENDEFEDESEDELPQDHEYFGTSMFEGEFDEEESGFSPEEILARRAGFGNMNEEEQQFYLQLLIGQKEKEQRRKEIIQSSLDTAPLGKQESLESEEDDGSIQDQQQRRFVNARLRYDQGD